MRVQYLKNAKYNVQMAFVESKLAKHVTKFCNKCNADTTFRLRKSNKQKDHYNCTMCIKSNDRRSHAKNWYMYLARKANARKREGSDKLTKSNIETLAQQQNFKCALTGIVFSPQDKWWKPSLDRIDNNLGYTVNNVRLVGWIVNHCRGNLTDEEFVDMCNKVTEANKYDPNT